jgi:hypothetical protein
MSAAKKLDRKAADMQLKGFIEKFDPKDQRLIRAVRSAMRKRFPTANELVWDNYNFFVIGYSPTERPTHSIVSVAARSNGVGLCFIEGLVFTIRRSCCLDPANRLASFVWSRPAYWRTRTLRRSWPLRSIVRKRLCQHGTRKAHHSVGFNEAAAAAEGSNVTSAVPTAVRNVMRHLHVSRPTPVCSRRRLVRSSAAAAETCRCADGTTPDSP